MSVLQGGRESKLPIAISRIYKDQAGIGGENMLTYSYLMFLSVAGGSWSVGMVHAKRRENKGKQWRKGENNQK